MEGSVIPSVCIIGAGNVATHMAIALSKSARVTQVYSHTRQHACDLARRISDGCEAVSELSGIRSGADYYIVSVKDDAIADVARNTPDSGIWAHTSGSVPMEVFAGYKSRYGVFYPLQTFSKDVPVDFNRVPMFIEGCDAGVAEGLMSLARTISEDVMPADSTLRKKLHVAAVFACNFVNFMWMQADELLRADGMTVNVMAPLLQVTLDKLKSVSPYDGQTGPARRGDRRVIERHLAMLDGDKGAIYGMLSEMIMKKYGITDEQD